MFPEQAPRPSFELPSDYVPTSPVYPGPEPAAQEPVEKKSPQFSAQYSPFSGEQDMSTSVIYCFPIPQKPGDPLWGFYHEQELERRGIKRKVTYPEDEESSTKKRRVHDVSQENQAQVPEQDASLGDQSGHIAPDQDNLGDQSIYLAPADADASQDQSFYLVPADMLGQDQDSLESWSSESGYHTDSMSETEADQEPTVEYGEDDDEATLQGDEPEDEATLQAGPNEEMPQDDTHHEQEAENEAMVQHREDDDDYDPDDSMNIIWDRINFNTSNYSDISGVCPLPDTTDDDPQADY